MINLLSYEKKSEIRVGRMNIIIVNYIFLTLAAVAVLAAIMIGAYITLNVSRRSAEARISQNASQIASYKQTSQQANTYRSNLVTAKQIIAGDISYSSAYVKIAQVIPAGVVLDTLKLDPTSLGSPLTFSAHAVNESAALALKSSFESHTELFSNVHFDSIINGTDPQNTTYPVSVSISATLTKEALQ